MHNGKEFINALGQNIYLLSNKPILIYKAENKVEIKRVFTRTGAGMRLRFQPAQLFHLNNDSNH